MLATEGDVTFRWGASGPALEAQSGPARADAQKAVYAPRTRAYSAFAVPVRTKTRLDAVRRSAGLTWGELMEAMLDAYMKGTHGD